MNLDKSNPSTLFQDRDLNTLPAPAPAGEQPRAWFSTEPEGGDRLDGILRCFLVVSLLVSLVLCGLHLENAVQARDPAFATPASSAGMTAAQRPAADHCVVCVAAPRTAL